MTQDVAWASVPTIYGIRAPREGVHVTLGMAMHLPPIPPLPVILAIAIVIFLAIGLHEYAHCKFADMAGDPTPGIYGRVTLDLTKHFEPLGTLMMVITTLTGFGIGWGRPAPMDERKMRNPRWDHFAAVLAGPVSNLAQAVVYALALRLLLSGRAISLEQILAALTRGEGEGLPAPTFLASLVTLGVITNLSLAIFNLIPLGPLDGHWLVGDLLPPRMRDRWLFWQRKYGNFILLALIFIPTFVPQFDLLATVLGRPIFASFRFLTGVPF